MSPRSSSSSRSVTTSVSLFLDRVEGNVAVLVLDDRELKLPKSLLPAETKEGEYLTLTLVRDLARTKKAKEDIGQKRKGLAQDDDGGDISL